MSTSEPPVDAGTEDYKSKMLARAKAALEEQPEQIGPYRILERLGGGGMGEVYRAEQRSPIRREVALKLIKLGMDTKLVIARFEAERQALAMMDHPHIAKVYDAGAEETGRPYFVMEYVKGRPITEYADLNHLNIQERLELFEQVCRAIQHAHHKGVIHRDLKPGNVLVSTQDGRPFAKVIDFGIAKATAQRLTEKTLYTQHEQLLGTPQYMSPEQAEGSLDIDTRTDVYSLGVLLYELLAGSTPFGSDELKAAALEQIKKMIREVDPPKPSTRISMSGTTLPTLAASRRTEPRKLGLLVRGELDWIVMKSLEKDRSRRYDTPASLADDVRRYTTGQPVVAAPPSWVYRVRKYVRRRKGAVAATAAIAMLLVAGTIVSTVLAIRANRAEWQALDEKAEVEQEKTEVQVQRDAAVVANQKADAQARRAEEATAKTLRTESELCVDAGIAAEDKNDAGLAMLWFARALKLDAGNPEREEIQRRRISAMYSQHPHPVDIVPPDVPGIVKNGLTLQWDAQGVRVVDARTGKTVGARIEYDQAVNGAEFSLDGKYAIAYCGDGKTRRWELATGKLVGVPIGERQWGRLSPDGRYSIIPVDGPGNNENSHLHVQDSITSKPIGKDIAGFDNVVSPDSRLIVTADYGVEHPAIRVWKLSTGELVCKLCDSTGDQAMAFAPDAKRVATIRTVNDEGKYGAEARIWDAVTGKPRTPLLRLDSKGSSGLLVKFSPDGSRLLTTAENVWQLWDSKTGKQLFKVEQPGTAFKKAAFSPDGSVIVTYSMDGAVSYLTIRDGTDGSMQALPIEACQYVDSLGISHDNKYLMVLNTYGMFQIWDFGIVNPTGWLQHQGDVASADFSSDGKTVLTENWGTYGDYEKFTRIWDVPSLKPAVPPISLGDKEGIAMANFLTPDSSFQGLGKCFDSQSGQEIKTVLQGDPQPNPLLVSPNRHYVLASQGDDLGIWNFETGAAILTKIAVFDRGNRIVLGPNLFSFPAAFSPDDGSVVVKEKVLALPSGKQICSLEGWRFDDDFFRFSSNGRYLMAGGEGHDSVVLWDVKTGKRVFPPSGAPDRFGCVSISPDSTKIYIASYSIENRIWDIATGEAISPTMSQGGDIRDATFSKDGRYLATCDKAGFAWIWDTVSGKRIARFDVDSESSDNVRDVRTVTFSPDGNQFATTHGSYAAIWDFHPLPQPVEQLELLAECIADRRIDELGGIAVLSDYEYLQRRAKLLAACPELFQSAPDPPEAKEVSEHYRQAVDTQIAAAKTEQERKELAKRFTHGARIEFDSGWLDEAVLLNETAVKLDDSLLEARDNLALSYLWKERYDDALAIYKKYKSQHFNHEWYNADDKDFVFGREAPDYIGQLREQKYDDPKLDEIERLLAPTLGGKLSASETKRLRDAVGKLATVEGNIVKVTADETNDQVNLLLTQNFELHLSNARDFQKEHGEIAAWKGKHVAVTGVIKGDEKDKPMWVDVDRPSQIDVLSGDSRATDSGPRKVGK